MSKAAKIIIAGLAAVAAGTALYNWLDGREEANESPLSFDEFLEHQNNLDSLELEHLVTWFKAKGGNEHSLCLLAYPTPAMLEKFKIQGAPADLDPCTNLLQLLIDKVSNDLLAVRLISFSTISDQVTALFGDEDYCALEG